MKKFLEKTGFGIVALYVLTIIFTLCAFAMTVVAIYGRVQNNFNLVANFGILFGVFTTVFGAFYVKKVRLSIKEMLREE